MGGRGSYSAFSNNNNSSNDTNIVQDEAFIEKSLESSYRSSITSRIDTLLNSPQSRTKEERDKLIREYYQEVQKDRRLSMKTRQDYMTKLRRLLKEG